METTHVLVLTTVPTEMQATHLAHSIVKHGLAACVQIRSIRSVYRWKGDVCDEAEWLVMIKTTAQKYSDLELHIKENHPYETPEIVKLPIIGGSPEYLAWIDTSVE